MRPGGSLADRLREGGAQPICQVVRWLLDAVRGLEALHDAAVIHRDVKLSNLLVLGAERLWAAKFLSISFVRQIRLPRFSGEANLPPELLATHLGNGKMTYASDMVDVIGLGGEAEAISISAGWGHTCVKLRSGGVKCWGSSSNGQVGNARMGG